MSRLALVIVVLACAACRSAEPPPLLGTEGQAEGAVRPVVGEALSPGAPLRVQVLEVRRVAETTVRVELALIDQSPAGADPAAPRDSVEQVVAGFANASIVSADGRRRLFPLRDAAGEPVGPTIGVPEPGGRRSGRMVFAGYPREAGAFTLLVPGFPPIRKLRVE